MAIYNKFLFTLQSIQILMLYYNKFDINLEEIPNASLVIIRDGWFKWQQFWRAYSYVYLQTQKTPFASTFLKQVQCYNTVWCDWKATKFGYTWSCT